MTHRRRKADEKATAAPALSPPERDWQPRPYQAAGLEALRAGINRQMWIWHRRAGKDRTGMELIREEMELNVGAYWHLFPRQVQAKRAIWNGVDPASKRRFLEQTFEPGLRSYVNEQDMFIRWHNGSTYQLTGSDYYDRLVGSNVRGVVFSEWALCDPMAWEYIRPILAENGGWAIFITTYRGRNHAYQMARELKSNPEWRIDIRDITRTTRLDGTPVISLEAIEAERRAGMKDSLIKQEFYCDPMASQPGAIYGATMEELSAQRCGTVAFDPTYPVTAAWNLDDMPANASVVFFQERGNEIAVLGSRSWMFPRMHKCFEELGRFPWRATRHVLRIDAEDTTWPELFNRFELNVSMTREHASVGKAAALTDAMLERTYIDTVKRPWLAHEDESNNELLVDSLAGYKVKEQDQNDGRENFTDAPIVSYERYLARAVELYAAWQWARGNQRRQRRPNYAASDRAVI